MIPGVFNALTARLAERAGFRAAYQSGAALSASLAALPDVGLINQTEFAEQGQYLVSAVSIPVISDADTGFGEALAVERTVTLFESAGLAGLHLEDQQLPKRCGHLSGKSLVSCDEMVSKLKAAVAARRDPSFVIIARTDGRASRRSRRRVDRAQAYVEAGADMIFPEALESPDEFGRFAQRDQSSADGQHDRVRQKPSLIGDRAGQTRLRGRAVSRDDAPRGHEGSRKRALRNWPAKARKKALSIGCRREPSSTSCSTTRASKRETGAISAADSGRIARRRALILTTRPVSLYFARGMRQATSPSSQTLLSLERPNGRGGCASPQPPVDDRSVALPREGADLRARSHCAIFAPWPRPASVAPVRISWSMIFIKAFGLVAARYAGAAADVSALALAAHLSAPDERGDGCHAPRFSAGAVALLEPVQLARGKAAAGLQASLEPLSDRSRRGRSFPGNCSSAVCPRRARSCGPGRFTSADRTVSAAVGPSSSRRLPGREPISNIRPRS